VHPLQLYQASYKQEKEPENTQHLVNYVISVYTQEMLSESYIAAVAKVLACLGSTGAMIHVFLVTAVTTEHTASGLQLQLNNRDRALSFYARHWCSRQH